MNCLAPVQGLRDEETDRHVSGGGGGGGGGEKERLRWGVGKEGVCVCERERERERDREREVDRTVHSEMDRKAGQRTAS